MTALEVSLLPWNRDLTTQRKTQWFFPTINLDQVSSLLRKLPGVLANRGRRRKAGYKKEEISTIQKHAGKITYRYCPEYNKINERKYVKQNELKTEC